MSAPRQVTVLPDGGEWATAPLLDEANVGRYVWYVFNSNTKYASVLPIVKIGRTNIHIGTNGSRPSSLRVNPDTHGHAAHGTNGSGYAESVHTEQWRLDADRRHELSDLLLRRRSTRILPVPTLERMVELSAPGEDLTDRRHRDEEAVFDLLVEHRAAPSRMMARAIADLFYGGPS